MRVAFPPGRQRDFLEDVQRATGADAQILAGRIGVHARTFRDWRREKWQMDEVSLQRLCQVARLPRPRGITILAEYWSVRKAAHLGGLKRFERHGPLGTSASRRLGGIAAQRRFKENPEYFRARGVNVRKLIRIPAHSTELAEFLGIFLGDGGFRNKWQITISCNLKGDRPYAEFIHQLIKRLFSLEASYYVREDRGVIDVLISSAALVEFLEAGGIPCERKTASSITIPQWIQAERKYRVACLRGLMDTDGSVYQHRYQVNGKWYAYPKLAFSGMIPALCHFVQETLTQMSIPSYFYQRNPQVVVCALDAVHRYFEVVGTHNPRYRQRFEQFAGEVRKRLTRAVC